MKKIAVCLLLGFAVNQPFSIFLAEADNIEQTGYASPDKLLELSLRRLKESVENIAQKNDQLVFENDVLRASIQGLQEHLNYLRGQKEKLTGGVAPVYLDTSLPGISAKAMDKRKQRTEALITQFERDIVELKRVLGSLESKLDEEQFKMEQKALFKQFKGSQISLNEAQKRFDRVIGKSKGMLKKISTLKEEQEVLRLKITNLLTTYKGIEERMAKEYYSVGRNL